MALSVLTYKIFYQHHCLLFGLKTEKEPLSSLHFNKTLGMAALSKQTVLVSQVQVNRQQGTYVP